MPYYVYGIAQGDAIKLGITNNVDRRVRQLATGASQGLTVKWTVDAGTAEEARRIESLLHKTFARNHRRLEWFDGKCSKKALAIARRESGQKKPRSVVKIVLWLMVIAFLLWGANAGVDVYRSLSGLPESCGQLQHGDGWKRLTYEPLYTPFWKDDPCTGLIGFGEPYF